MEVRAIAKDTGISPRKVRPLLNVIRGKKVDEALAVLQFMPSPTARVVAKIVKSAAANADNNYQMTPSDLKIVKIFADEAPTRKWRKFGARGRFKPWLRRSSHISVVLREREE